MSKPRRTGLALALASAAFIFTIFGDPPASEAANDAETSATSLGRASGAFRGALTPGRHPANRQLISTQKRQPPDAGEIQNVQSLVSPETRGSSVASPVEAPAAPAVAPFPARRDLPPADAAVYTSRARAKIQQGDIAAARRLLERASDSGQVDALFLLAETYDPRMLARWGVIGVKPDIELAKALYSKAEARGASGAKERLLAIIK